ncbi:MAG: DUF2207 domain-containing protein [Gemmatimonadaceae bacterium]
MKGFAVGIVAMLIANALPAQERIRSYDVEVDVRRDASLDVVERITVHAEGQNIRRGIYRDFPTRYQDRYGNRVTVGFEMLGVERDGATEPWFTERRLNGIRINTGNDNFLSVPADYTYTLRYHTTRQLGFFKDHDELYWNAIGTGWIFPIEEARVRVRLPSPVPVNQMTAEAYTGPQGAKGSNYTAALPQPGIAIYQLTLPLGPYEGFTIDLTFPKGLISPPTTADRVKWILGDNRGILIALLGLIALLVYCFRTWNRIGRDPKGRAIIARYEPPADKTPAGLRYLERMGYDIRCFSSDILALAVAGQVQINREKHFLGDSWTLTRNGKVPLTTPTSESVLIRGLFAFDEDTLELNKTNAAVISLARNAHSEALDREFQPRYFHRNGKSVGIAVLITIVSLAVAGIASGGYGIPAIGAAGVLMLVTTAVFTRLVRAPTLEGRELLDEIEGLKLYLSVAERQELAQVRGPDEPPVLNEERYEALLPYAVALEVEDAWTKKFTAAVGAAAAAEAASRMTWYGGGPVTNLGDFTHSIGSSLSSQISSSSSPPGSGSGSGGGGSSGGGGGGGGGGGR